MQHRHFRILLLAKSAISAMLREKEVPRAIDVPKITLLEQLRKKLVEPYPTKTSEGAELLKDLIIQHRNEFPSLFRRGIDVMLEKDHASGVNWLDSLYDFTRQCFFDDWWNKDDDTEEEVELLLRIFPSVFDTTLHIGDENCLCLIHVLFSSAESVAFVPMVLQVGKDLGISEDYMGIDHENWPLHLLVNRRGCWIYCEAWDVRNVQECSPNFDPETFDQEEFDQECLSALERMREIGLVPNDEICYMMPYLLSPDDDMDRRRMEKRVRLLVSWYPRVLLDCNSGSAWESWDLECGVTLLYEFIFCNKYAKDKTLIFSLFETILELGMQYFPTELGFLFHGQTFRIACEWFGTEKIVELVNKHIFNKLMRNSNKKKTSTRWIVEAASHDFVSLDILYTLVRWDPLQCIEHFSTANRKRRNSSRSPCKGKKRKFVQQSIAVWLNRVDTLST